MSRAQGDAYRTHTDYELNAYKWRLWDKVARLTDHKEKWYKCGVGWILCEERNRMVNPNGSWKWHGWIVEAHEYWVTVFPGECVTIEDGRPRVIGWSQVKRIIDDDKVAANKFFNWTAKRLAKDLDTWIPVEANNDLFIDYEGRKPDAMITIGWEGDDYYFLYFAPPKVAQSPAAVGLRAKK